MAIRFTPGEDAVGADEGLVKPVAKRSGTGNGSASGRSEVDRPLGLVDLDARVAKLEAQSVVQQARIDALEGEVRALVDAAAAGAAQIEALEAALQAVTERDAVTAERDAGDAPMTPAERAKAYRQRKAKATLPANVAKLPVPKSIGVRHPSLGKPAMVIAFAEAVAARRAVA